MFASSVQWVGLYLESKRQEDTAYNKISREDREATLAQRKQATREDVSEWLVQLQKRRRDDGRQYVNAKQFETIEKVAKQVMQELPNRDGGRSKAVEPLRWVVHGGYTLGGPVTAHVRKHKYH